MTPETYLHFWRWVMGLCAAIGLTVVVELGAIVWLLVLRGGK